MVIYATWESSTDREDFDLLQTFPISVLTLSGINTESFSAHSTRAAASSAAARAGVALKNIMNAADWTNESTFKKFYHKPLFSASFGRGVFGLQASPAQDDDEDQ